LKSAKSTFELRSGKFFDDDLRHRRAISSKSGRFRSWLRSFTTAAMTRTKAEIESIGISCNRLDIDMAAFTVSPKYQVVTPKEVREGLAIAPGDKIEVIQLEGRIELVPVPPMESLEGSLKGVKNTFEREDDRCLP
jgi:AbrB family looped-hinge helix DNA binding protein